MSRESRAPGEPAFCGSTGEEVTKLLPTGAVCVPGSNTYLLGLKGNHGV
jgi:hypothetical protein